MFVRDLRKALEGVDDDLEVVVRLQHEAEDGGDCVGIGGVFSAEADAGCTDKEVFMIDAHEDEIEDTDEEDEEDDPV